MNDNRPVDLITAVSCVRSSVWSAVASAGQVAAPGAHDVVTMSLVSSPVVSREPPPRQIRHQWWQQDVNIQGCDNVMTHTGQWCVTRVTCDNGDDAPAHLGSTDHPRGCWQCWDLRLLWPGPDSESGDTNLWRQWRHNKQNSFHAENLLIRCGSICPGDNRAEWRLGYSSM